MSYAGLPPRIDGFVHVRWLGGGGFADVHEYRQEKLDRPVAVKVLKSTIDNEGTRELFDAEANLMAKVAKHPNIATIHDTGVSADRRPYIVMEYYPLGHLGGEKLKRQPLPYQSVLEIGVKIAGAVEEAHRARVIHRDIKPENILANEYDPVLTDFGISAAQTDTHTDDSRGYSPGYAPKEILENTHPGDARSDVYSLAATLWALLAGHSPFDPPNRRSTNGEIVARALNDPVPALSREIPASIETVLRQALDKDPERRPQSAHAFGELLQGIERDLGLRETRMPLIPDRESIESAVAEMDAVKRTMVGRGAVVDLGAPGGATAIRGGPGSRSQENPPTAQRGAASGPDQAVSGTGTAHRDGPAGSAASLPAEEPVESPQRRWLWPAVGGGTALVVAAVVLVAALGGGQGSRSPESSTTWGEDVLNPGATNPLVVAPVTDLTGRLEDGVATFEWAHDDGGPSEVDFLVQRIDGGSSVVEAVAEPEYVIDGLATGVVPCVTVTARVQGRAQSEPSDPVCATS